MQWQFETKPIKRKDILSSLRIALRDTKFRAKSNNIATWVCDSRNNIITIQTVETMLARQGIYETTYDHFEWLARDILEKHANFRRGALLRRTHVPPVQSDRRFRVTEFTVYPRGIKVKNVSRKAVTACLVVVMTPKVVYGKHNG